METIRSTSIVFCRIFHILRSDTKWKVNIPEEYKVGHEAHFAQVTEKYLQYLKDGALPAWEIPNMITKYYTTTQGLEKAME